MAYMSQEKKKEIVAKLKAELKDFDVKYTVSVINHSTIRMNIKSSSIDFISNYQETTDRKDRGSDGHIQTNIYYLHDTFSGEALKFLEKAKAILNDGNFDESDPQTDYFHVGWYSDISIGAWDKPFVLTTK